MVREANANDLDQVLELYRARKDVEKMVHLASFDEIQANDFNLNIPRYVDNTEKEPEIDLGQLTERMKEANRAIKDGENELLSMLGDLAFAKPEIKADMEHFMAALKEV